MDSLSFINRIKWRLITRCVYRWKLLRIGARTTIFHPLRLEGLKQCIIGNQVFIGSYSWIMGNPRTQSLHIMDGVNIGNFAHIVAMESILIKDNALIADKVFITDNTHCFGSVSVPFKDQGIRMIDQVTIGEGSWIGEGVSIIGASIGNYCVIGANSVVTHDIPDYSIAVGTPAEVIKKFSFDTHRWEVAAK